MNHIAFLKFFFVFSFSRQKQDEVMKLESQIRYKAEEQRKAGQELDSTCQICLKTKFADGIGHICNYCNVRCCARCGGKVALRSSKVRFMFKVEITLCSQRCDYSRKVRTLPSVYYIQRVIMALKLFQFHS